MQHVRQYGTNCNNSLRYKDYILFWCQLALTEYKLSTRRLRSYCDIDIHA